MPNQSPVIASAGATTSVAKVKIYCAGPLFNAGEKAEMFEIACALENSGYSAFLPHRDGLEYSNLVGEFIEEGIETERANQLLHKAIFYLDVFHVIDSDGLLLNINGRVPDEGAMVEAGIAWNAGKKVIIYKNDSRTLINGTDNPLLMGLAGFKAISAVDKIPNAFSDLVHVKAANEQNMVDSSRLTACYHLGRQIAMIPGYSTEGCNFSKELIAILDNQS